MTATTTQGGPAASSERQASPPKSPAAPSAAARPAPAGHTDGSVSTVLAIASATSSYTTALSAASMPVRKRVAPSTTPWSSSVLEPGMASPAAVRRIHPPCAIACSRSDRGASSSTVSSVSAMVDRSGNTRSIREDRVRTLIRTTWLTGPKDASPAIPVPGRCAAGGARTDAVADGASTDPLAGSPTTVAGGGPGGNPPSAACGAAGGATDGVNTDGGANPDGRGPAGSISSGRGGWT